MKRLIYTILSLAIVAVGMAFAASPKKSQKVGRDRQQASQQVQQTKASLQLNQQELALKLDELNAIEARLDSLNRQISRIKGTIAVYDDSIARLTAAIDSLNAEIDGIKGSLGHSLRDSRSRRQSMSSVGMVMSAKSFNDGMRRISYIRQLDRSRVRKANSLAARRLQLQASQDRLAAMRQKQQGLLATLDAQQAAQRRQQTLAEENVSILRHNRRELDNELKRRQKRLNTLTSQLDRLLAEEAAEAKRQAEAEAAAAAEAQRQAALAAAEAKRQAEAEAQRQAAAKEQASAQQNKKQEDKKQEDKRQADKKQEDKKQQSKDRGKRRNREKPASSQTAQANANQPAAQASSKPAKPASADKAKTAAATQFADKKGALPYPITGEKQVVGFFGRTRHHDLSKVEIDNPGIDIQGRAGAQAQAVHDGQVTGVFLIDGLHNAVLIRHGEFITVYANIDSPSVKKGDKVSAGQSLGTVHADEGKAPVLHFEIRKEKEKLNPIDWLK